MGTVSALGRIAPVAEAQHGLVTARQANARGVPRRDLARLAQAGGLERVAYGVYRVVGSPRTSLLDLRAAWLQLAPGLDLDLRQVTDGVVSHSSATLLYDVGLLEPAAYEFSVAQPRRIRSRRDDVVIHSARLTADDVTWVNQMLVTVPTRILADLGAQTIDGEHLAGLLTDLISRDLVDGDAAAAALAPYADRYGGRRGDGAGLVAYLLSFEPGKPG
jgi:predicted transcriptional regulator of viral defense system